MKVLLNLSLLFYVLFNALGSIPAFVTLLKNFSLKRQSEIIIREMIFALLAILVFIIIGEQFFDLFNIKFYGFQLGGGLLLFLVALKMVFVSPLSTELSEKTKTSSNKEPIFFPLAFPIITGPAVLTNLLVYMQSGAHPKFIILTAILIAWMGSLFTLLLSGPIYKAMGKNGLYALERIFGLLLLLMGGNLIIKGFFSAFNLTHCLKQLGLS
ncbi:MAG: MarC family protein [Victivallaceae bacterium]